MPLPLFILKRLLAAIPTLLVVSMLSFLMMRYNFTFGPVDIPTGGGNSIHILDRTVIKNPIDPLAGLKNNPQISQAAYEQEKKRLGLDKPMAVQYWLWLSSVLPINFEGLADGDWGHPFKKPNFGTTFQGEEVTSLIALRAGNTMMLNVLVIALTWLIALPPGIYAALNWRSISDRMMTVLSSVGMSFPSFVLALVLAMFVVKYQLLPYGGAVGDNYDALSWLGKVGQRAHYLILPVFILVIGGISGLQRQMRSNLLDVLGSEYVRTARVKGLPESQVIQKHAMRNALNPLITMFGLEFASLLSGSLLVERVLNYPGLGLLMYRAVVETDTNLVMASLMMSVGMLVLGNLASDILLKVADPRIELE